MILNSNQTIADSLKPTFENVTREFITETLYKLLFSDELPNFRFIFTETEAIEFIDKTLSNYRNQFDDKSFVSHLEEEHRIILQRIKEKSNGNSIQPAMIINNYKDFFEQLRSFYEKDIELYFLRTHMTGFTVYEKNNCFEQIWLRATPEDFNNPEEFLRKQVEMLKDTTFEKYDKETYIGKLGFLDNNILCIKNGISRTWDENSREIEITIYDKTFYNNPKLFDRPHCTLPIIRYGIYEKNGKRVCSIGSIQNTNISQSSYEQPNINKKVRNKSYKLNNGISEEYREKVDPKSILALSIFIDILNQEEITDIEVPCMYVLDYEYHRKRNKTTIKNFKDYWTKDKISKFTSSYQSQKNHLSHNYNKQNLISEIKTEGLIRKFQRLLNHYQSGVIESYPGDIDNFLHIHIPIIKSETEIKGDILVELYRLISQRYQDIER